MKKILVSFYCLVVAIASYSQKQWNSKHIKQNKSGSLVYVADEKGDIIPDFSGVGFYANAKEIPSVPVVKTLFPPDTWGQQLIQSAIDEVAKMPLSKNGYRGTILLKKGIYKIAGRRNQYTRQGKLGNRSWLGRWNTNYMELCCGKSCYSKSMGFRKKLCDWF
jgi:hypothetical protein